MPRSRKPEQVSQELSIEASANYEGNDSLAVIDRARNSIIHEQIVDLLYKQEMWESDAIRNEEWEPYLPEGWTGEERFKLFKGKRSGRIIDSAELDSALQTPLPTREEIAKELDDRIDHVAAVTEIEFSSDQPSAERMTIGWEVPLTGEKPTAKQMSIIEAHEKGHRIRPYHGKELEPIFMRAFDPSRVDFTDTDYEAHKDEWRQTVDAGRAAEGAEEYMSKEDAKQTHLDYLFTPTELAERMSQLKNYFGMQGAEPFTKAHLDYARTHYVQDVGYDNGMTHMFQAVTPEKEEEFLKLINSAGI